MMVRTTIHIIFPFSLTTLLMLPHYCDCPKLNLIKSRFGPIRYSLKVGTRHSACTFLIRLFQRSISLGTRPTYSVHSSQPTRLQMNRHLNANEATFPVLSTNVLQQLIHLVWHGDIIRWGSVISHNTGCVDWQGGNDYEIFHSEKTIGRTGTHRDLEWYMSCKINSQMHMWSL